MRAFTRAYRCTMRAKIIFVCSWRRVSFTVFRGPGVLNDSYAAIWAVQNSITVCGATRCSAHSPANFSTCFTR